MSYGLTFSSAYKDPKSVAHAFNPFFIYPILQEA